MTSTHIGRHRKAGVISTLTLILITLIPENSEASKSDLSASRIRYGSTVSGYFYMNGGSCTDEQQLMEQRSSRYNLKLVLVPPRAIPLAALSVFVANNTIGKIEQIILRGPWVYFQLPAGTYTIGARVHHNFFLLRNVRVQRGVQRTYILKDNLLHRSPARSLHGCPSPPQGDGYGFDKKRSLSALS